MSLQVPEQLLGSCVGWPAVAGRASGAPGVGAAGAHKRLLPRAPGQGQHLRRDWENFSEGPESYAWKQMPCPWDAAGCSLTWTRVGPD